MIISIFPINLRSFRCRNHKLQWFVCWLNWLRLMGHLEPTIVMMIASGNAFGNITLKNLKIWYVTAPVSNWPLLPGHPVFTLISLNNFVDNFFDHIFWNFSAQKPYITDPVSMLDVFGKITLLNTSTYCKFKLRMSSLFDAWKQVT